MSSTDAGRGAWERFAWVLVVLAGALVYANSLGGAFVFDDTHSIVTNRYIESLWPPSQSFWGPPGSGSNGRPLVAFSLAVNYALGGRAVFGYHVFNVAVHVAAALALLGLLRRLFPGNGGIALACALLWVVHPLHTDALNHVVYRNETMMALFYLLTLYFGVRGTSEGRRGLLAWSVAACWLGALCKEPIASAPLVMLLLHRARSEEPLLALLRRHAAYYAGLFASLVPLALLIVASERGQSVGLDQESYTTWEWARTQPGVVAHYLRLAVFPAPLVFDYYGWPKAESVGAWLPYALVLAAGLALSAFAAWRRCAAGVLGLAFFLVLAPTSSVIPVTGEVVAEHRMVLPLAFLLGVVAAAAMWGIARRPRAALPLAVLAGLATAGLGYRTHERNRDYESEVAIWEDTVEKRPDNARAWDTLGSLYAAKQDPRKAREAYEAALRATPGNGRIHYNYANLMYAEGDAAGAIAGYRRALERKPELARAAYNLGQILVARGDAAEGLDVLRRALVHRPDHAETKQKLAWFLATWHEDGLRDGAEAERLARELVALGGRDAAVYLDTLAAAQAEQGEYAAAAETARAALAEARRAERGRVARRIEAHLSAYAASRPWREGG